MLDRSRIPRDLWIRVMWVPRTSHDPDEVPIVLVSDRTRFWRSSIPMILAFLLAIGLSLLHAPIYLALVLLLLILAASRYAGGGRSGYYEVKPDGSLGDFLGRRIPVGLREMERKRLSGR